jgi:hypothetical protein
LVKLSWAEWSHHPRHSHVDDYRSHHDSGDDNPRHNAGQHHALTGRGSAQEPTGPQCLRHNGRRRCFCPKSVTHSPPFGCPKSGASPSIFRRPARPEPANFRSQPKTRRQPPTIPMSPMSIFRGATTEFSRPKRSGAQLAVCTASTVVGTKMTHSHCPGALEPKQGAS